MSEVKWNDSQLQAINARDTSLIVSAAAGSGKTAVLVQRLLEILSDTENRVSADRIAVVTFTNDAAAQMKQRLTEALAAAIEKSPDDRWLIRQQSLINSAKISTIHTFCFDMIRDNLRDLDVSTDFKILDETDENLIIAKALDTVFERLYTSPDSAGMMNRLVEFFSKGERREDGLEEVVLEIYKFLMSTPFPDKWMQQAKDSYSETDPLKNPYCTGFLENTIDVLEGCAARQRSVLAEMNTEITDGKLSLSTAAVKGNRDNIENVLKQTETALSKLKDSSAGWNERIAVTFDMPENVRSSPKISAFVNIHRRYASRAAAAVNGINSFTAENIRRDFKIMQDIIGSLHTVISMLTEEISALKSEKNALAFSDAEQLAIKLLCTVNENGEPVRTKLAEELSEYYRLIMIDEFQDANENQNLIFRLLSHNGTPEKNGDNLFVVGDIKQSIYGFRLANPAIFRNSFKTADPYTNGYEGTNSRIVFSCNYRSSKDVIDFTNFVFERIMTEELGGVDYTDGEKLVLGAEYPEKDRSTVLLLAEYWKKDKNAPDSPAVKKLSANELEAEAVAARIASMIGKAEIGREDSIRKCTASDFCILLRDNKRGQLYRDALEKHGILSLTEEADSYLEETEVAVILNLLRIIDNPMYDIPMVSVLMSPIFMLTADETAQLRMMKRKSVYSCLKEFMKQPVTNDTAVLHGKLKYFTEVFEKLRFDAASLELEKLIRTIYDRTDYISSVQALNGGTQKCANLRQLLVYAEAYSRNYDGGLPGFIRYADDILKSSKDLKRASVITSTDCVSIKTIHKSKGLEYPFVFLCGTGKKFRDSDEKKMFIRSNELGLAFTIQDHEHLYSYEPISYSLLKNTVHHNMLSEEMRLLYVAMTRAKEQLFISMVNDTESTSENSLPNRAKLFTNLITSGITPDIVSEAVCMRDWLTMAFAVHPSFKEYAAANKITSCTSEQTDSRLTVSASLQQNAPQTSEAQTDETVIPASEETIKLLTERFSAAEKSISAETAAKLTITEIAKDSSEMTLNLPDFSQKYHGLTAAQAGTAMHTFMQYADFEAAEQGEDAICLEADRMEDMGILSHMERLSLDMSKLYGFFTSDLYLRMKNSEEICREKKFLVKISELSLDDKLSEEYNNNNSMLQGIADCFFVENGEIVLIDYKTDRVNSEKVLAERYSLQLKLYSAAFEKIRRQKVKEAYLYSFALGRKVSIPLG
ncbi:MAG: helicase-exonuclease AddAB subunit AddA [Oscillospiraceae bacterium]|nr:helicase-exonuclease AddAB subunit AddA [Oscillospiraceae bacterium]